MVIATNVSSLSDARYFAARMVDFIAFDSRLSSEEGIPIIKEIQGWIEGVHWVCPSGADPSLLSFILSETGMTRGLLNDSRDAAMFSQRFYTSEIEMVRAPDYQIVSSLQEFRNREHQHGVILRVNSVTDLMPFAKEALPNVALAGGREEKTGVSDFDQLDEIFDFLEEHTH